MTAAFTAAQIAAACGITKTAVAQRARNEGWAFTEETGRGGTRRLYQAEALPAAVRARLVWSATPADRTGIDTGGAIHAGRAAAASMKVAEALQAAIRQQRGERDLVLSNTLPRKAQQRMDARIGLVQQFEYFAKTEAANLPQEQARILFATLYNAGKLEAAAHLREHLPATSAASIGRWQRTMRSQGIVALAGAYGNRTGSGKLDSNPEMRDYVVALLVRHAHVRAKNVLRSLRARFGAGASLPSERALERWIAEWRSANAELVLALANPDAWKNKHMFAFGSASEHITRINQVWELDSTPADVMCTDGRYAIIGGIDVATRRARLLVVRTSRAVGVAALLRCMLLAFGVPTVAKTDNGSDYTSAHVQRVLRDLGVQQELCPPFQPQKKPHIERFFKTFSHGLLEIAPGYIGHSVEERKAIESRKSFAERLMKRDQAVELRLSGEQLQDFCDQWVEHIYHQEVHEGLGLAPVAAAAVQQHHVRHIEDERALDVLLAEAPGRDGRRTVQKKGIKLDDGWFIAAELDGWVGREVQVRYDPLYHDLGTIYVFGGDELRFICVAQNPDRTGADRREIAIAAKRMQRERVQAERRALKAAARRVGVDEAWADVLRERAQAQGKLALFTPRTEAHTSPGLEAAAAAARANEEPERTTAEIEHLAEIRAAQALILAEQVPQGAANELFDRRVQQGQMTEPAFDSVPSRVMWLLRAALHRPLSTEQQHFLATYKAAQPDSYASLQSDVDELFGSTKESAPGRIAGDPGAN